MELIVVATIFLGTAPTTLTPATTTIFASNSSLDFVLKNPLNFRLNSPCLPMKKKTNLSVQNFLFILICGSMGSQVQLQQQEEKKVFEAQECVAVSHIIYLFLQWGWFEISRT